MLSLHFLALFCLVVSLVSCDSTPCGANQIYGLDIGHNVTYYGTTANAPKYQAQSTSCNSGSSGTVWFTFTPAVNSIVTVNTCGPNTNFDTFLGLFSGDCGDLYCVLGNDDTSCSTVHASLIQFQSSGERVYIGLTGYSTGTGNYEITFSEEIGPVPSCTTAQPLIGPFFTPLSIEEDTENGSTSTVSSCGLPTDTSQVWYTLETDSANPLTITTCNSNTNFDTVLSLLSGNCTDFECILHNDDNCTLVDVGGASTLHFSPIPNFLYYLVVSGYSGTSGTFVLDITQDEYVQDGCTSAFIVNVDRTQSIQGTTVGGSILPPAVCDSEQGPSMWYSIYSPSGQERVTFSICNNFTLFDASMSIYSNSCTDPVCVASTVGGCDTSNGVLEFSLNPNEFVYLVVASADGSSGSFEIDITL